MKTKISIIIVILLLSIKVNSQITFKPGVRVGLNFSKITKINDGGKTSFYIGAIGELKFGKLYALQPEIIFTKQGSEHVDLNYLSIGLANKFYLFSNKTPIYILIKPSLDFNGESETVSNSNGTSVNFDADFVFSGGIGYTLPIGLDLEFRIKKGVVNVYEEINGFESIEGKNSVIQIGAVYKFSFRK